jgi:hypothetical protein
MRRSNTLSYAITLACVIGIVGAVIVWGGGTNPKLVEAQGKPREQLGAAEPPSGWYKLDAGDFSVFAPQGWGSTSCVA